MEKSTILLAGGTGLIGSRLAQLLRERGHALRLLSRSPRGDGAFFWDPAKAEIDSKALDSVDFVINLAGAGIADKRWTAARKREILESRVLSANLLCREIEAMKIRPKAYLSASAVGYYGNSGENLVDETSLPADHSFMAECCRQWEVAADQAEVLGLRTLKFRIGVVLAKMGGALPEITWPMRFGLGAYFADGKAWWPWIHLDDVCRGFIWGIENQDANGVFNLVAPHAVRGKEFVNAVVRARRKPALILPAPAFALRLYLGEMAAVVLNSNLVSAEKIRQAGFEHEFTDIDNALHSIFAPPP